MTAEQIKSKFRIYQENDKYYIQEKLLFGWAYDISSSYVEYDNFVTTMGVSTILSALTFLISTIVGIFQWSLNNTMVISFCTGILSFSILVFYLYKSKNIAVVRHTFNDANWIIDDIVNTKLKKEEEEEKIKNAKKIKVKKYHYFYSTQQLRKEKLKKLK